VERWFQNSRGVVIVVAAIVTCAILLAIDPGDGFPTGASSSGGDSPTVTTTATTLPPVTTSTVAPYPTLQEGTGDTANTTVLQQKLQALNYSVTPDGDFGAATKAAVIQFQTAKGISPADGVVNAATWSALLAPASSASSTTTTTKAR
jgi:peptidoglycan hydrolase-like protein with peptidoglycan-binding domain